MAGIFAEAPWAIQDRLLKESKDSKARTKAFVEALKKASATSRSDTLDITYPELAREIAEAQARRKTIPKVLPGTPPKAAPLGDEVPILGSTLRSILRPPPRPQPHQPADTLTAAQRAGAPAHEILRNTPGTLEHAMAIVDLARPSRELRNVLRGRLAAEWAEQREVSAESVYKALAEAGLKLSAKEFVELTGFAPQGFSPLTREYATALHKEADERLRSHQFGLDPQADLRAIAEWAVVRNPWRPLGSGPEGRAANPIEHIASGAASGLNVLEWLGGPAMALRAVQAPPGQIAEETLGPPEERAGAALELASGILTGHLAVGGRLPRLPKRAGPTERLRAAIDELNARKAEPVPEAPVKGAPPVEEYATIPEPPKPKRVVKKKPKPSPPAEGVAPETPLKVKGGKPSATQEKPPTPAGGVKEPWEMTQQEFARPMYDKGSIVGYRGPDGEVMVKRVTGGKYRGTFGNIEYTANDPTSAAMGLHREFVKDAAKQGKFGAGFENYGDLQKQYAKPPAPARGAVEAPKPASKTTAGKGAAQGAAAGAKTTGKSVTRPSGAASPAKAPAGKGVTSKPPPPAEGVAPKESPPPAGNVTKAPKASAPAKEAVSAQEPDFVPTHVHAKSGEQVRVMAKYKLRGRTRVAYKTASGMPGIDVPVSWFNKTYRPLATRASSPPAGGVPPETPLKVKGGKTSAAQEGIQQIGDLGEHPGTGELGPRPKAGRGDSVQRGAQGVAGAKEGQGAAVVAEGVKKKPKWKKATPPLLTGKDVQPLSPEVRKLLEPPDLSAAERAFLGKLPIKKKAPRSRMGLTPEQQADITAQVDRQIRENIAKNEDMPTPEEFREAWRRGSQGTKEYLEGVLSQGEPITIRIPGGGGEYTLSMKGAREVHKSFTGREVPVIEELIGGKAQGASPLSVFGEPSQQTVFGEHGGRSYFAKGGILLFDESAPKSGVQPIRSDAIPRIAGLLDAKRTGELTPLYHNPESKTVRFRDEAGGQYAVPREQVDFMYKRGLHPMGDENGNVHWVNDAGETRGFTMGPDRLGDKPEVVLPYKVPKLKKTAGVLDRRVLYRLAAPTAAAALAAAVAERKEDKILAGAGAAVLAFALTFAPELARTPLIRSFRGEEGLLAKTRPSEGESFGRLIARISSNPGSYAKMREGTFRVAVTQALDAKNLTFDRLSRDIRSFTDAIEKHIGKLTGRSSRSTREALNALGEKMRTNMRARWDKDLERVEYTPKETAFLQDWAKTRDKYHGMMWERGRGVQVRYEKLKRAEGESVTELQARQQAHNDYTFWNEVKKGIVGAKVTFFGRPLDAALNTKAVAVNGRIIGVRTGSEAFSKQVAEVARRLMDDEPGLKLKDARARARELIREDDPFTGKIERPYFLVRGNDGVLYRLEQGQDFMREGLNFYGLDYFHQIPKAEFVQNLTDKRFREAAAELLHRKRPHVYPTKDAALEYLGDLAESAYGDVSVRSFLANLETPAHGVLLPEMLETDFITAATVYMHRANKRIAVVEQFGADPASINNTLSLMTPEDQAYFQQVLADALSLGPRARRGAMEKIAELESAYSAVTLLPGGTTHLAQVNDLFYPLGNKSVKSVWRGVRDAIRERFGIETEAGHAVFEITKRKNWRPITEGSPELQAAGGGSKMERFINRAHFVANKVMDWTLLAEVDRDIKTINAATALHDAAETMDALARGGKKALKVVGADRAGIIRKLKNAYGMEDADIRAIERRGSAALENQAIALRLRRAILAKHLYSGHKVDFPQWMGHPVGQVIMRFRRPLLTATRFFVQDVIAEAFHGNVKPLLKTLTLGGLGGWVLKELRDAILARTDDDSIVERLLRGDILGAIRNFVDGLGSAGVLGVFYELNPVINPAFERLQPKDWLERAAQPVIYAKGARLIAMLGALGRYLNQHDDDPWAYAHFVNALNEAMQQEFILYRRASDWTGFNLAAATNEAMGKAGIIEPETAASVAAIHRLKSLERKLEFYRRTNKEKGVLPGQPGFQQLSSSEARELVLLRARYGPPTGQPRPIDTVDIMEKLVPESVKKQLKPRKPAPLAPGFTRG